jgi:hypothetical protein
MMQDFLTAVAGVATDTAAPCFNELTNPAHLDALPRAWC